MSHRYPTLRSPTLPSRAEQRKAVPYRARLGRDRPAFNLCHGWWIGAKSARGSCDGGSVVAPSRSARGTYQENAGARPTRSRESRATTNLRASFGLVDLRGGAEEDLAGVHEGFAERRVRVNRVGQVGTSQPISMASTASAINSPAPGPTMPQPKTRSSGIDQPLGQALDPAQCLGPAAGAPGIHGRLKRRGLRVWPALRSSRPKPIPGR